MRDLIPPHRPATVLAPMQDITDLPFMRTLAKRGAPDWFVTEFFRVHPDSSLDPYILKSITENPSQSPVFAQLIGSDIPSLVRIATQLLAYPIAGIDLNLGCPAPIVCRKNAGGGLLRNLNEIDSILGALRDAIPTRFTVKTRIGYHSPDEFPRLLEIFKRHAIDGLSIHARTVTERYQSPVHPDAVRMATQTLTCPIIANGNAVDLQTATSFLNQSSAHGIMVGRGAIRNPWIFSQIHAHFDQLPIPIPCHRDLLEFALDLYEEVAQSCTSFRPIPHVQRMKKSMTFLAHGIHQGAFEFDLRRAVTPDDFFRICHSYLDHSDPLPALPPSPSKLFSSFESLIPRFT